MPDSPWHITNDYYFQLTFWPTISSQSHPQAPNWIDFDQHICTGGQMMQKKCLMEICLYNRIVAPQSILQVSLHGRSVSNINTKDSILLRYCAWFGQRWVTVSDTDSWWHWQLMSFKFQLSLWPLKGHALFRCRGVRFKINIISNHTRNKNSSYFVYFVVCYVFTSCLFVIKSRKFNLIHFLVSDWAEILHYKIYEERKMQEKHENRW